MTVLTKIRPKEPLKTLKWYDILIVTIIMFGEFIIRSTQQFLQSLQSVTEVVQPYTETTTSYSDGAAYSSNFILQVILLAIALLYLVIRHYDFKQLKIRFHWSVLIWVPLLFTIVGLFGDVVTTLSGEYNYFDPALVPFMNPQEVLSVISNGHRLWAVKWILRRVLLPWINDIGEGRASVEGFSILNTGSFLIPHLPRHALGTHYRCGIWIVLLLHVQKSGQKLIAILPYARIGRYVWFNLHLLINRMGILIFYKAHPERVRFSY